MKIEEIYNQLNEISSFELQEKWDNSGLLVGEMNREFEQIVIALDIDREMLEYAKEDTLFIVHHPLIFSGLKQLDFSVYPSNLLEIMIQKRLSLIAMHTNFDKTHLNSYVFEKVLGFKKEFQDEFICRTTGNWTKDELLNLLKTKLNLETLRVVSPKNRINSIALTTGAGASLMDEVNADCFLTGDIKYHDAMKAMSQNLMMVDIGHYESEKFFVDVLMDELKNLGHLGIISQSQNPFKII
ncbi:Nif3-like dinuclear metal center hexameric protein [Sulfurovum sp. bin170]|uniref:Nif3-like dinuclear metal center hexameric protein n=1 Tax=Sulfurovum sp. bin170 TaxID=2695268 RepID=UPI0013DF0BA5|nr:Nif3-like dinuclear metal center hexameric protein [Sulfurovum sp. bin170]NEW61012.1 Nif3-like dinuclear metal center hexameric protein [Sulfurovum sp. bin170]